MTFIHDHLDTVSSLLILLPSLQDTLTGSTELALVIGFLSCPGPESSGSSSNCPSPLDEIGTILYNGSYDPDFHNGGEGLKPPYQNFSVVIPRDAESGVAQLSATHFSLVGAGPFPFLQSRNVTLLVE
ncbi:hypothetical protein B0H11DRAFT_2118394 [Mycena galericulata]|nr:hypothetical protein B0H11DRAFT_2118394 [Mycena galericulata]